MEGNMPFTQPPPHTKFTPHSGCYTRPKPCVQKS
jgi:hypothetical protein